ncbi:histidyl-tRNA synthetase [Halobacillus dabanensis]|uniref:Histidine--tRNA ligase n=1 Tax=Halobacillus dabanensis TaxID=240302 RepID=A0A1I3THK4_HALDA|nr:histidine--tRNA ligase [Halobacillus dabanensis]SFJ70012.1 histidyl-tRNA synthetase [Halobacillus dabanensis]
MKKLEDQNVKGTQDYLPEEERVRRRVKRTLEDVFIKYGCKPLETPILNYTRLMASKYAGGAEILEEMYRLTDRGERDLALRYDLTIPFAKVVAMNPTITMPFKRYEIGKVFRDGPIKTGRFREFTQCDVDIVGVDSQIAEAELMMMGLDAFDQLGLDVVIQYNNRKMLIGLLKTFGTPEEKLDDVVLTLDKLEKIGITKVLDELGEKRVPDDSVRSIKQFLIDDTNTELSYFESYVSEDKELAEGMEEIKELQGYLEYLGIDNNCKFNPFLARGLEIYTGTIYEIFMRDESLKSSIGSGGRYDNAVGGLLGSEEPFSTVGISFGLDVIFTAMTLVRKETSEADVDVYIIPMGTLKEALKVAQKLRGKGYRVEVDLSNRKIGKAMNRANKENIPNVVIVGEKEVANGVYRWKDMRTGQEREEGFLFSES